MVASRLVKMFYKVSRFSYKQTPLDAKKKVRVGNKISRLTETLTRFFAIKSNHFSEYIAALGIAAPRVSKEGFSYLKELPGGNNGLDIKY